LGGKAQEHLQKTGFYPRLLTRLFQNPLKCHPQRFADLAQLPDIRIHAAALDAAQESAQEAALGGKGRNGEFLALALPANDDANTTRQGIFPALAERAKGNPYVSIFITESPGQILSNRPALFLPTLVGNGDTTMDDKRVPLCPVSGQGSIPGKKAFNGNDWVCPVQH